MDLFNSTTSILDTLLARELNKSRTFRIKNLDTDDFFRLHPSFSKVSDEIAVVFVAVIRVGFLIFFNTEKLK